MQLLLLESFHALWNKNHVSSPTLSYFDEIRFLCEVLKNETKQKNLSEIDQGVRK